MFNGKTVRTCIREREIQFNLYTFQPIAMRQRKSLLCSKDVFGRPHDGPGNFEMQVPKVQIEFKKGLREKSRPSLRLRGYQIGGVKCMRQIRTQNRYYVLSKTGSKNSFERQNLLFTPMKRSPSGWPMGQGGRVSLMSSDPVPDLSRPCFVIPDMGHRKNIVLWFRMDTRYLPAGMTDGAIKFTPNASRLLFSHACRVTTADGLTRPMHLTELG